MVQARHVTQKSFMECTDMPAGLQVINSNGIIQIDSEFKNLQFIGKGTVSLTSYVQQNIGDAGDMVAFRVNETNRWGITTPRIYSNYTPLFISKYDEATTITYYKFKFNGIAAGNNFEVYNSAGERCFSDSTKFMKVLGFAKGSTSVDPLYFYHDASLTTAVISCKLASRYNPLGGASGITMQLFNFNGGTITAQEQRITTPLMLPLNSYRSYAYMVIDVTGY